MDDMSDDGADWTSAYACLQPRFMADIAKGATAALEIAHESERPWPLWADSRAAWDSTRPFRFCMACVCVPTSYAFVLRCHPFHSFPARGLWAVVVSCSDAKCSLGQCTDTAHGARAKWKSSGSRKLRISWVSRLFNRPPFAACTHSQWMTRMPFRISKLPALFHVCARDKYATSVREPSGDNVPPPNQPLRLGVGHRSPQMPAPPCADENFQAQRTQHTHSLHPLALSRDETGRQMSNRLKRMCAPLSCWGHAHSDTLGTRATPPAASRSAGCSHQRAPRQTTHTGAYYEKEKKQKREKVSNV
eukprot:6376407-Prymnesium_polylepis.3